MTPFGRIPIGPVVLLGLLALLVGCSTLRPLSADKVFDGHPVKTTSVVVPADFSFKAGLVTHTLPAGTYTPVLEDDHGIYFQSPRKHLMGGLFGPTLYDGGLFFKGDGQTDVYEYLIIEGSHSTYKLPEDFKFSVESKP